MAKKKGSAKARQGSKRPAAPKKVIPPPFPLAMVVCDAIHRDPATKKPFILGCFSVIVSEAVPATHPLMGLYIELTNGHGLVMIKVQLVDANEEFEPVWVEEQKIEFEDPRMVMQLAFIIRNAIFGRTGEYRFQLFASGEFLMERRVLVITKEQMS